MYPEQPSNQDAEHLRLLATFHTVMAALMALFSCVFIVHVVIGTHALSNHGLFGGGPEGGPPPAWFGAMFVVVGTFALLAGWTMAVLVFLAGRYLKRRQHYVFCLVVAALCCTMMPFGTILGVFTLVVLQRPTAKAMFDANRTLRRPVREYPV